MDTDELRAELEYQWRLNHAERCDNTADHRDMPRLPHICYWPYPDVLRGEESDLLTATRRKGQQDVLRLLADHERQLDADAVRSRLDGNTRTADRQSDGARLLRRLRVACGDTVPTP